MRTWKLVYSLACRSDGIPEPVIVVLLLAVAKMAFFAVVSTPFRPVPFGSYDEPPLTKPVPGMRSFETWHSDKARPFESVAMVAAKLVFDKLEEIELVATS